MAQMSEMNANLMFASGMGHDLEPGEIAGVTREPAFDRKISPRRRALGANAVLDGDFAFAVAPQRSVNCPTLGGDVSMHKSPVFLLNLAPFPNAPQFQRGGFRLGDEHKAAGFAVETVD